MAELKQWTFPSPSHYSSSVDDHSSMLDPMEAPGGGPQPPCGTELNSRQREREWSYMVTVRVLSARGSSLLLTFLCQRKARECV